MKIGENFEEISENSRKISPEIFRKFPGKSMCFLG